MVLARITPAQFLRVTNIPWPGYLAYSDGLQRGHIRVTYDQGELEIMALSPQHQHCKKRLARLVEALTEELGIPIASFGSMTCRREDLNRALEADECYWIDHEAAVRDRDDIDLTVDPPPDLVLEVEISRSTLDRVSIFAALGVREVWRWDGKQLRISILNSRGVYRRSSKSRRFPFLPMKDFASFLANSELDETRLLQSFRTWIRVEKNLWLKRQKTLLYG